MRLNFESNWNSFQDATPPFVVAAAAAASVAEGKMEIPKPRGKIAETTET